MTDAVDGPAAAAVPCGRCGYDLRGTAADGVCSECGLAAAVSVAGPSPEWLRRVERGTWLMVIVVAASYPTACVIPWAVSSGGGSGIAIPVVAGAAVYLSGVWLLTSPVRWGGYTQQSASAAWSRFVTRVAGTIGVVAATVVLVLLAAGRIAGRPGGERMVAAAAVLLAAGWAATFVYARRLALIVGDAKAGYHAGVVAAGGAVSAGLALVALPLAFQANDVGGGVPLFGWAVVAFVSGLYGIVVLRMIGLGYGRLRRSVAARWETADGAAV